jgi:DNA-directed RNA polymerase subunit RPC12/RpoP
MDYLNNPEIKTEKGIICKHCGIRFSVKETAAYLSSACKCGFAIIYKQNNLKGVFRFIPEEEFSRDVYYSTGRRKKERELREEKKPY